MLDQTTVQAPEPARPVTTRSRAALNLPGLCPLCGHDAPRRVLHRDGATLEAYRCPVDGEVAYHSGRAAGIDFDGRHASIAHLVGLHTPAAPMPHVDPVMAPLIGAGS